MMQREDGFVSLFTTIMISLLLIIITTSLVSLEVLQLRKSEDSEQSMRAYYAAEAGIEDAVKQIRTNPQNTTDKDCTAPVTTNLDSAGSANWTCQRISFSGSPTGSLVPDAAKTVDPGQVSNPAYGSVIIEWGKNTPAPGNYNVVGSLPDFNTYVNVAKYSVPPIEIAMVTYPNGYIAGDLSGSSVKLENALIVPRGLTNSYQVDSNTLPGHAPWQGRCAPPGQTYNFGSINLTGYSCYAVITNLSSSTKNYLFRIRSRYIGTDYRMTFVNGPNGVGSQVNVPDGTATIDVTAYAGAAHRRVLTKLPLGTGAAPGLDYVLYSDNDICKNFSVINNAFPSSPGC